MSQKLIPYINDKKGNYVLSPKVFDELLSSYKAKEEEEDGFTLKELEEATKFVAMCVGGESCKEDIMNTLRVLRRSFRPFAAIRGAIRTIALSMGKKDIYEAFSQNF